MKKIIKILVLACLVVSTCVVMAACGEKPVEPCETHTDADANLVCDVCSATLTPAGPTQAEIDRAAKESIVKEMNTFLASGVSLIKGERKLPNMSGPVTVETCTLPSSHWISRLNGFYIVDGRIKMTLANDNQGATAANKDVYIGITPTGIYSIEDDTVAFDYTTHLYTNEQMRVWADELETKHILGSNGVYSLDHSALVDMFSKILLTQTAQSVGGDLYDRALINRLVEIMKSTSEIKLNGNNQISSVNIRLYTEDNGLKTDICTVVYTYEPAKQYLKLSLNLNYIMDIEYENVATTTFQVFQKTFKYHTEKPGDRSFRGTDIVLKSKYSMDSEAIIKFENDIIKKIEAVEDSLVYAKKIKEKYSDVYNIVETPWVCDKVYVYDERYDVYILFSHESEDSGRQVVFDSIEFDCDLTDCCLGTIDLQRKRIFVAEQDHSNEEKIRAQLSEKYAGEFTAAKTECLSVAVYDTDFARYVLFKRISNESGGYVYIYSGVSKTVDKTTTCIAEANIQTHKVSFLEHNTNHTTH